MKTREIVVFLLLAMAAFGSTAQGTKDQDILNGPKTEYYPDGKISKQYMLSNGVLNGYYRTYSKKGYLEAETNMVNGIPQGVVKTFYENGNISSETNMVDGVPQGIKKDYYENGVLKIDSYFTGDPSEYTGRSTGYYEDGVLKSESKYSMGKIIESITYDRKGRVTSVQSEGKVISYWYETNGKKHTSINGVEQDN